MNNKESEMTLTTADLPTIRHIIRDELAGVRNADKLPATPGSFLASHDRLRYSETCAKYSLV